MHDEITDREVERYRLEIEGSVAAGWAEWFEAEIIAPAGASTVLEIRVADQAELYGRLRRIHDLNIRLISVIAIGRQELGARPGASTTQLTNEDS